MLILMLLYRKNVDRLGINFTILTSCVAQKKIKIHNPIGNKNSCSFALAIAAD